MLSALKEHRKPLLFLAVLCGGLFAFKLGAYGLLDPDEPFYALTSKEMLTAGNWLVPTLFGEPQFEKPIFFYWLEMVSFKTFGFHEWSARLAPCLAGFITVFLTYAWAQVLFRNKQISFLAALILATAAEYVVMTRVVLTDMVFCFFVTATWFFSSLGRERAAFFFSALGSLTKGPLGFMIPFMSMFTKKSTERFKGLWVFFLTAVPWYGYMVWRFGTAFLYDFFIHENVRRFFIAEHRGMDRIFFYPAGFLGGFFPWSVFILPTLFYGIRQAIRNRSCIQKIFFELSLGFWLPLLFFMMAKSKLLSYTFPLYPVLAILMAAWGARFYRAVSMGAKIKASLWPWAIAVWGVFPPALVVSAFLYSQKSAPEVFWPVIVIGCVLVPLSWAAFISLWRRHLRVMIACLTVMMAGFAVLAYSWMLPMVDVIFSSRKWVEWYNEDARSSGGTTIAASKIYVRGVSYYSGQSRAAVVSENGRRAFYTRHAIPIYSDQTAFLAIPQKEYPLFCFLKLKELNFLKRILDSRFRIEILHEHPTRVLIKLQRTPTL